MKQSKKSKQVKTHFDKTDNYIKENYNIIIRAEIIKGFLGNSEFDSILDIACGSGEISSQFLTSGNQLTLLDISESMLAVAKRRIPLAFQKNVIYINEDILTADLPPETYDLIICTGLLAHVDDPVETIRKILTLSKHQGAVLLQNTRAEHFLSRIDRCYRMLTKRFSSQQYMYNAMDEKTIMTLFQEGGFKLMKRFSYIQSFLSSGRLLRGKRKYHFVKTVFGTYDNNRFPSLGNDCLYYFEKQR